MHHPSRRLITAIVAGLLIIAIVALAARQVDWFVTSGVSMNPTYNTGDLVLVVSDPPYEVGQIVAYRNPVDNAVVLHRIVGGDATGWEIKGDNNHSVDPVQPSSDMLIGRAVLHLPKVGHLFISPIARGVALLTALILLGAPIMSSRRTQPSDAETVTPNRPSKRPTKVLIGLIVLDLLFLAGVAFAFAFAEHPSEPRPEYAQTGTLTYTASVTGSETYPTGVIETGDTVFTNIVHELDISFHQATDAPAGLVASTAQLDLTVSTPAGWHSLIPLAASVPLEDGGATMTATLNLRDIRSLADRVSDETGTSAGIVHLMISASGYTTMNGGPPVAYKMEFPFELGPFAFTAAGVDPAHAKALVSTLALSSDPNSGTAVGGLVPTALRLWIIVALLVCLALTVLLWPTTQADEATGNLGALHTRVGTIQLPTSIPRVLVSASEELEAVAIRLNLPVLDKDSGWSGVLTPQALYWTGNQPEPTSPAPRQFTNPQWIGSEMTIHTQLNHAEVS